MIVIFNITSTAVNALEILVNHCQPGLVFRKIGLLTFFREPIELKELTPMPPKVKTGILKSPSKEGSNLDVS